MRDEEIEKALEIHRDIAHRDCSTCPYRNGHVFGHEYGCNSIQLTKDVLDYVYSLKAELQHANCHLEAWEKNYETAKKKIREQTAKEILQALYNCEEMDFNVIKWFAKTYYDIEVEE